MIVNQIKVAMDRQEELQRITPDFPVAVYQTDFSHLDYQQVNWHWHEDFQLCWVTNGEVRFHVVDQIWEIAAGKGIFINKKVAHTAEPLVPMSAYFCVDFHPNLICSETSKSLRDRMLRPFESNHTSPCFMFDGTFPDGAIIINAIRQIIKLSELKEPFGWELLLQSELLQLWPTVLSLSQGNRIEINAQSNRRIQKIITYLNNNYQDKITLQAVAQEAFLCPAECSRFFKRLTGRTIFQYLIQFRIEKSCELLSDTDASISEIANLTGFSSQSYFSVCFQKQKGYTPNQYRKEVHFHISKI